MIDVLQSWKILGFVLKNIQHQTMASSSAKKLRLQESDSIQDVFKRTPDMLNEFKQLMRGLTVKDSAVCMVKIANCNGSSGCLFSDIFCETKRNIDTESVKSLFAFKSLFKRGWRLINKCIENSSFEPSDVESKVALCKLGDFLFNHKESEVCLQIGGRESNMSESEWCQIVSHHYFSKLAVNSDYVIDNQHTTKKYACSGCKQLVKGVHGNTSIGHEMTWHGYVDILLGSLSSSHIPIVSSQEPVSPAVKNKDEVKVKDARFRKQMIAQTIVFSFLQMRYNPEYTNFLIPTIALSRQNIVFFFYDAEHDILLESPPQKLFETDKKLNPLTVLLTWLVSNYKLFCSGVSSKMLEMDFKCNFPVFAGDKLELYKNELDYGNCTSKSEETFLKPWRLGNVNVLGSALGDEESD